MAQDDVLRWQLERADRLRADVASASGFVLTAGALALSGLALVTRTVWQESEPVRPIPGIILAQLAFLVLAWGVLTASIVRAVAAVAAANGFRVGDYPSRPSQPPLMSDLMRDPFTQTATLTRDLEVAADHLRAARSSLHKAGFNLMLVPLVVFLSFIVRGVFS